MEAESNLGGKIQAAQSSLFLRRKPLPLPDPLLEGLTAFRPLVAAPSWRKLLTLLTGTRLAQGRRRGAGALRHRGTDQAANFSPFQQGLKRARGSPLAVSRQRLLLIVEPFVPCQPERVGSGSVTKRWRGGGGARSSLRGHSRARALARRNQSVRRPGLRWLVMAGVVPLPPSKPRWAWPGLCVPSHDPRGA